MKALLSVVLCLLAACSRTRPAESSYEITGTQTERVAAVSRVVGKHSALPSAILDAHFLEEKAGDDVLGPSDFTSFCVLKVAPSDIPAWHAMLHPLGSPNTPPQYAAPKVARPWWISQSGFLQLEFYDPKPLSGRSRGWVGIAPMSGEIFVYTFTM